MLIYHMESLSYEECKEFMPIIETAKCVKVFDGDTFHLGVMLPSPYNATRFCCRLLGVDTPELRSREHAEKSLAREARDIVKSKILNKLVNVRVSGHDKYGRLLARLSTDECGDLSQFLINEKVAVYYDGGKKRTTNWANLLKEHSELRAKRLTHDVTQDELEKECK